MPDTYTRMKRRSEIAVLEASTGVAVRLSNVYGPEMSASSVLAAVLRQIPGAGPLLVNDASPIRDFLWVEDAAEGIAALATIEGAHGVLNLATGIGTSIGVAARVALDLAGEPGREIVSSGRPQNSVTVADYSRTTRVCGWRPRVSLGDGLALLVGRSAVPR
jgi:dTDP-glucose 4,6-dehydratase